MKPAVYLDIRESTTVHEKKVLLKDVGRVYCSDPNIQLRCSLLPVRVIKEDRKKRYVESVLDVIRALEELGVSVSNLGKTTYVIDYQPGKAPAKAWEYAKTALVCFVCFFGAAFAIMTFNNDVNVTDVFGKIYLLVMGEETTGTTILELSYSIGLAIGILVFFNHFARWKLNADPTPLEVEMKLYDDNITQAVIQSQEKKEIKS